MKHLLILFFLALLIADSSAQKPIKWKPLKGPNTSSSTNQLLIGANGEIISVGKFGYYSTENDGATWKYHKIITPINSITEEYLSSKLLISTTGEYYFCFGSPYYFDALSHTYGVYYSTDRGLTWVHRLTEDITGMIQSSDGVLFATFIENSSSYLYESIDKGLSWTKLNELGNYIPVAATDKFLYLTFGGQRGCIQYSFGNNEFKVISNYCQAFTLVNDNTVLIFFSPTVYLSDGTSAIDSIGRLFGTTSLVKGAGGELNAVVNPDNDHLFVYSSLDQGKNWNMVAKVTPYRAGNNYSINFSNLNLLFYGNDTALYLSRDRGSTWKEIGMPFDSINNFIFSNNGRIFATSVGSYNSNFGRTVGHFELSSDNGETWHKSVPAKEVITKVGKGINGSIIAIAPDSLTKYTNNIWVYDSTLPSEWEKVSVVAYIGSDPIIRTDGTKSVYISTNDYANPLIYRSDDNGFSWLDVDAPNTANGIYSLDVSTDGVVYFGSYPVMYRSEDKGATWTKLLPLHEIVKLSYIKTFGAEGVLLGTEGAGLLISSDKGNSWSRFDGKNFDTVTCIGIDSKGDIVAGTNRGLWLYDPIPKSWTKIMLGDEGNFKIGAIDVAANDDIYIGTYGSSVWVGSRNYNAVNYYSPVSHSSMQLSPNPTTGRVAITLEGVNEEEVRLELYDILGRKISTILDGKYSGEIYFNTSSLPNGIYTLMLSGGQNKDEKKLIVQH